MKALEAFTLAMDMQVCVVFLRNREVMDGRISNNETVHFKLNFVPLEINLKNTLKQ
jgi:hypothetical protein